MEMCTPDYRQRLERVGDLLLQEFPDHEPYIRLQQTWNGSVLEHSARWMPRQGAHIVSIGSFLGAPEIVLAQDAHEVVCCDMADFLPQARPTNVKFQQVNLDAADLRLPDGMYDACFIIEVLEHLRWSPLPLLAWARDHCNLLVISTPDDLEWPPMQQAAWTTRAHFRDIPAAWPGAPGNPQPMDHCKQYSQAEFVELLDHCGFRLVEFQRMGGGGHQMLAIAQVRTDERGKPLVTPSLTRWDRLRRRLAGGTASARSPAHD